MDVASMFKDLERLKARKASIDKKLLPLQEKQARVIDQIEDKSEGASPFCSGYKSGFAAGQRSMAQVAAKKAQENEMLARRAPVYLRVLRL